MKTAGWIGTGQMGTPMVQNLLKAGFSVNLYNRTPEKAAPLVAAGAFQLASPAEVVKQSDVTFLMLTNGAAIGEVMEAQAGVLAGVTEGTTIVDMSTIAPMDSTSFAHRVAQKGGRYIDAPVSGSVGAAESAQLVILVGALESELGQLQPFFDALGKKTIAFGEVGKGSSAKLAINLLLGITAQGIAESLLFAEKAGVDLTSMLELIGQSAVNTPLFQFKKDMYARKSFPPAFALELMTKDLGLITDEAQQKNITLPLAQKAQETYSKAKRNGKGKEDMAAVYLEIEEQNKNEVH
jgi:3-hydroxyisobutyrate dehydrogenase